MWFAEDYDWLLKKEPDPLKLADFFPCPEPLYGHRTNSSLIPTPEYLFYQDQALELDLLATRLYRMIGNLKRRGVYDASAEGPDNQLSQLARAEDNVFLPYKGFAALMEKGGLKGVFQTEDLAPIIAVIEGLSAREQALLAKIYDITGISDILRGSSNPNETATAQRIKGQFGSLRLVKRQKRVKEFVKSALRIKLEIIAEHFTRETLSDMTGIMIPTRAEIGQAQQQMTMLAQQAQQGMQVPPDAQKQLQAIVSAVAWEDIEVILRSDKRRGYRIDVETDATAKLENDEQKQARMEFVTSMQGILERSIPAVMQMPELAPLIKEMTMFGARAFKIGRTMEETIDDAFDQITKKAMAAAQQPKQDQDPRIAAEAKYTEAKTQATTMKAQTDAAVKQQKMQYDAFEAQQKAATRVAETQIKQQAAEREAVVDSNIAAIDQATAETKRQGAVTDLQAKTAKLQQAYMPDVGRPM